jgi:uncharacterized membrane protein
VRLSIWQFVVLVLVAALVIVVYRYWWADQSQRDWVDRFNNAVFHREAEETKKKEPEPELNPEGWEH